MRGKENLDDLMHYMEENNIKDVKIGMLVVNSSDSCYVGQANLVFSAGEESVEMKNVYQSSWTGIKGSPTIRRVETEQKGLEIALENAKAFEEKGFTAYINGMNLDKTRKYMDDYSIREDRAWDADFNR